MQKAVDSRSGNQLSIFRMNTDLDVLRLFVRVAQRGSFSAAGRDTRMPQSTVSRLIAALEARLGFPLFTRTTRIVTLTEAGRVYLERVEPLLLAMEEAEHEARGGLELRGTLRVGLSSSMVMRHVLPNLHSFLAPHAHLKVQLLADDQRQDLVGEGVDLALRLGVLESSAATARRLANWPLALVASPGYLALRGPVAEPGDLPLHDVIAGPNWRHDHLTLRRQSTTISVRIEPRILVTMNEAATSAAVQGLGIAYMSAGGCAPEITSGALVRLLPEWDLGSIELHAVYPAGRAAKPAARAFAEHLATHLKTIAP